MEDQTRTLGELKTAAQNMIGWLKFLGIVNIVSGVLTALSLIGIVFAWLPIWLGALLLQAANKAASAHYADDPRDLVLMMDKLRLYFLIQGIVIIIGLALAVVGILSIGTMLPLIYDSLDSYAL